jgi:hypothetical protein
MAYRTGNINKHLTLTCSQVIPYRVYAGLVRRYVSHLDSMSLQHAPANSVLPMKQPLEHVSHMHGGGRILGQARAAPTCPIVLKMMELNATKRARSAKLWELEKRMFLQERKYLQGARMGNVHDGRPMWLNLCNVIVCL